MSAVGQLLLRLALATVFVAHGAHKLFGVWAGPGVGPGGPDGTMASLAAAGLGSSFTLAVAAGLVQFAGGLLIGAGALTRWACLALFVYLLVGLWTVHVEWGFFLNWTGAVNLGNGIEYSLALMGGLLSLGLSGPGDWSVDGHRENTAEARASARARVRNKF